MPDIDRAETYISLKDKKITRDGEKVKSVKAWLALYQDFLCSDFKTFCWHLK